MRPGWVTVGKNITHTNFKPQVGGLVKTSMRFSKTECYLRVRVYGLGGLFTGKGLGFTLRVHGLCCRVCTLT
jgi:hypothetical protein